MNKAMLHIKSAMLQSALKVHYATFYEPVNKQRDRALDTTNSSLEELKWKMYFKGALCHSVLVISNFGNPQLKLKIQVAKYLL